jgi:hypothetical protein
MALSFVSASFIAAQPANAAPTIPLDLQGTWVLSDNAEDCADPDREFWIIGPASDLYINEKDDDMRSFFTGVYPEIPQLDDNWSLFQYDETSADLLRREGDTLITYITDDISASPTSADIPAILTQQKPSTFQLCKTHPVGLSLPFAELISFSKSNVIASCMSGGEVCAQSVFSFLDVAPDGELRSAEIARGMRIAILAGLGASIAEDGLDEDAYSVALGVLPTLPLVGFTLVKQLDYDGSGGVSLAEFSTDLLTTTPPVTSAADIGDIAEKIPFEALGQLPALFQMMMQ